MMELDLAFEKFSHEETQLFDAIYANGYIFYGMIITVVGFFVFLMCFMEEQQKQDRNQDQYQKWRKCVSGSEVEIRSALNKLGREPNNASELQTIIFRQMSQGMSRV